MPSLAEGLRHAAHTFGRDFVLTQKVVGYLSDFHCWDNEGVRTVFREAIRAGCLTALAQHLTSRKEDIAHLLDNFTAQLTSAGYNATLSRYVFESLAYALGWRDDAPQLDGNADDAETPKIKRSFSVRGVDITMVHVAGGKFSMGATPEHALKANYDERPPVTVELSSFLLAGTQVTQRLWTSVMGTNPSFFIGEDLPVERVSWEECAAFLSKLNSQIGQSFRLPTEAEWEYAARGGCVARGYAWAGGTSNLADLYCWHDANSDRRTHPVAMLSPNELGLYDMSGNVSEWCSDWYFSTYISSSPNPQGPPQGTAKVARGGSWHDPLDSCRVAKRFSLNPCYRSRKIGLRLALSIPMDWHM